MMPTDTILNLYKYFGETPLECINRYRDTHPEYTDVPMTYAGRLDPLAEGVLVVLTGEMVHKKDEFLHLPKTYRVQALLGVSTDSYDMLGVPSGVSREISISFDECKKIIEDFVNLKELSYPPFSSRTVNGVPLFTLAKEEKLPDVLPMREVVITKALCNGIEEISREKIFERLEQSLHVNGDFRQDTVKESWEAIRGDIPKKCMLVDFSVSCGSGVYMRTLAKRLGESLGIQSLAYSIVRESVGEYEIKK